MTLNGILGVMKPVPLTRHYMVPCRVAAPLVKLRQTDRLGGSEIVRVALVEEQGRLIRSSLRTEVEQIRADLPPCALPLFRMCDHGARTGSSRAAWFTPWPLGVHPCSRHGRIYTARWIRTGAVSAAALGRGAQHTTSNQEQWTPCVSYPKGSPAA